MERKQAEEFASNYWLFSKWFNSMTELTVDLPDARQGKRIREILGACWLGLEEEIYSGLRNEHPDLFVCGDLEQLRDIACSLWNPIGLASSQALRNQYDRYLQEATEIVAAGQSQERLETYLADICKTRLGLENYSVEMATEAAQEIVRLVKLHLR